MDCVQSHCNFSLTYLEQAMKKLIFTLFGLVVLLSSCKDAKSIVAPSGNADNMRWISMPTDLKTKSGLKTENTFISFEMIEGKKGGNLKCKLELVTPDGDDFKIQAKLKVPKHSFNDNEIMLFTMEIDQNNTVTGFSPTPFTFDIPLEYEIEYKGLDLTGVTPENISFAYIAGDGSLQVAQYENIDIDYNKNKIKVKKARIPHFSRFGFVKIAN